MPEKLSGTPIFSISSAARIFSPKFVNMTRQGALTAQEANCIVGCIKSSMASWSRETIQSLYCALVRPHLEFCAQPGSPQDRRDMELLESVQRRATKMIRRMEQD